MHRDTIIRYYEQVKARLSVVVARGKTLLDRLNAEAPSIDLIERAALFCADAQQLAEHILRRYQERHDRLLPRDLNRTIRSGLEAIIAIDKAIRPWSQRVIAGAKVLDVLGKFLP